MQLKEWDGPVVPVTVHVERWAHDWIYQVHLVPDAPLLPGREYEVRNAAPMVVRFTTGDAEDDIPPPTPEVLSTAVSEDSDYGSSCGDYRVHGVAITVQSEALATYVIREDGRFLAEQDLALGCGYPRAAAIEPRRRPVRSRRAVGGVRAGRPRRHLDDSPARRRHRPRPQPRPTVCPPVLRSTAVSETPALARAPTCPGAPSC